MLKIKESDMYYPLLLILKCYQGKATKEEITSALALVLRAPKEYLETLSGFKTAETQFMKDLNWAGNRLGHAGLLVKVRGSHWELTPLGMTRNFSDTELAIFVTRHNK
jgi:Mrr N-terminal domain